MLVSEFDFTLPEFLIATRPCSPRDAARLLVVKDKKLQDSIVSQLPGWLSPGDILVFNNTKVIPARLYGMRGQAKIEILLHKKLNENGVWQCFAKPAKKLRLQDKIIFAEDFSAIVREKLNTGEVLLEFSGTTADMINKLKIYGQMPLPPYIERNRKTDASDAVEYQTIYADDAKAGAVAAPTAGLHFTTQLLEQLKVMGVQFAFVTLHVGAGTFLPVKAEDTSEHIMHGEWLEITATTADAINEAKENGGRVIAVGTTSMRVLESVADGNGKLRPSQGETDIFITPGYRFKCVDILLTNFHLPRSTLFMLVSAFAGMDEMRSAYMHAIDQAYRFYSYGDACLLFKKEQE